MTLKNGFYRFQGGYIFNEKVQVGNDHIYMVVMDVVNDVSYSCKSVITRVVITLFNT